MTSSSNDLSMLIDGKLVSGEKRLDVVNPATEAVIGSVPDCTSDELNQAVAAARRAFPAWRDTPLEERRAKIAALGQLIGEHADELAKMHTAEQGKPLQAAAEEIGGTSMLLGAIAQHEIPVNVAEDSDERLVEVHHVPIGVVAAIAPWNFPIALAYWKVAPALLTGNTMVLKPSPFTPMTTLKIAELAKDIFPAGVFNVVTGGDDVGPWLTSHPDVGKISFTGSSATGSKVMQSAAATLKRVTLELGGNDSAIVMPDVDLDTIVPNVFWAAFANSGQVCIASKRIYVHEDIYDKFRDALVNFAKTVKMGDGTEEGVELGPIQNAAQFERVKSLISDCVDRKLEFALGPDDSPQPNQGYFVPITIIDNPPEDAPVVSREAFGPVVPLMKFKSIDDVIERANDTDFGLGNSIWSADTASAAKLATRLESGMVWINTTQYVSPFAPFGGHKQSGIGVESGMEGLLEFTNTQTIVTGRAAG